MAVAQPGKIRPILNLSAPPGHSLNDAITPSSLRKLKMNTAKKFGQALNMAGKNAIFQNLTSQMLTN
jgi:hypothetical protein